MHGAHDIADLDTKHISLRPRSAVFPGLVQPGSRGALRRHRTLRVGREPEYQAFTALCEKDRDAAHTWIINVNKWQRFYATKGDSETTANPASA